MWDFCTSTVAFLTYLSVFPRFLVYLFKAGEKIMIMVLVSVGDPLHFGADPDPRIRTSN